jgi:hypothetical protein
VQAVPYKIHTVLTDNGTHFTDPTGDGWTPEDIRIMRRDNGHFVATHFNGRALTLTSSTA